MRPGIQFETGNYTNRVYIYGPITDVHMHPRLFDALLPDQPPMPNGKAGIDIYSRRALLNGFTMGLAMLNESVRLHDPSQPDLTEIHPYPVNSQDRLLAAASIVTEQSRMATGLNMIVDPSILGLDQDPPLFSLKKIDEIYSSRFVQTTASALKIYGGETTGGYMVPLETIIPISEVWHEHNPTKPVILHLEDEDVKRVLEDWPEYIPVHIAHVSSRQEMEPIIEYKDKGKDITCETTPHHMFLTHHTADALGPYGCMKPTLKSSEDRQFLWDNLEYIDIFASDCAPHRELDKVGLDGRGLENPAYGVTNHDVFLPLFFQAVLDGRLTENELFDRIVRNPCRRFNLPVLDTAAAFRLQPVDAEQVERQTEYGCSPFSKTLEHLRMNGRMEQLKIAGRTVVKNEIFPIYVPLGSPRYENLIRF